MSTKIENIKIVKTTVKYVDADEGGEPLDQYTEEEIRELCCQDQEVDPCAKKGEKRQPFYSLPKDSELMPAATKGLMDLAEGQHAGTAADPYVRIVYLDRKGKKCGDQVTKFKRTEGCCDGIPAMEFDYENSPEYIPAGEYGELYWTGGKGPFELKLPDSCDAIFYGYGGFTKRIPFEYNLNKRSVRVLVPIDGCCRIVVTIKDQCDDVLENDPIRGGNGRWFAYPDGLSPIQWLHNVSYGNTWPLPYGCNEISFSGGTDRPYPSGIIDGIWARSALRSYVTGPGTWHPYEQAWFGYWHICYPQDNFPGFEFYTTIDPVVGKFIMQDAWDWFGGEDCSGTNNCCNGLCLRSPWYLGSNTNKWYLLEWICD